MQTGRFRFAMRGEAMPGARDTQDFVGVNYYTTDLVTFKPLRSGSFFHDRAYPQEAEQSMTGFIANVPQGFYRTMEWATRFKLPIMITENGVEDADDTLRPRYTVEHLHQVWRAANFNWQLKGYFHWSLVDNFEWERGWTQRFGLWGLDVDTQARVRRPSVDLYAEICRENGITSQMVEKYAPQIYDRLFPST